MKKVMAVLIALVFAAGTAVASPLGEGGGSSSDDGDSNLAAILMVTVVAGFAALLVGDIISDNAVDSQDALAGIPDTLPAVADTGVDWDQLHQASPSEELPVIAVTVFRGGSGRDLARYFTRLLAPGEDVQYVIQGTPVALGSISSTEAAATAFSFLNVSMVITGDETGFQLFENGIEEPVWSYDSPDPDSAAVRLASTSLLNFLGNM